jgi:hypothetical protein
MEAKFYNVIALCEQDKVDAKQVKSLLREIDQLKLWKYICVTPTVSTYCMYHLIVNKPTTITIDEIVFIAYRLKNIKVLKMVTRGSILHDIRSLEYYDDWDDSVTEMASILFKQTMLYIRVDERSRCYLVHTIPQRFVYKMATMFNKWMEYPYSRKVYQKLLDDGGFVLLVTRCYKYQEDTLNIIKTLDIFPTDLSENIPKYYFL